MVTGVATFPPSYGRSKEDSMVDPTTDGVATSEHRFPAAYSQGFAHIRILSVIDPDSTGPLGMMDPFETNVALESAPRAPIEDMLRAD
jgi:hypothetical protein